MTTPATLDELFPSKYLAAIDAPEETIVTVKGIEIEMLKNKDSQKDEPKPILYFNEFEKGMVLNKTNKNALETLYGNSIPDLIGKRVILHAPMCDSFGKTAPALRIKAQRPPADKATLLKAFSQRFEKARALKIENLETFAVSPNMTEAEIIKVTLDAFHGPEGSCGATSSGGTESIFLAMLAYRQ
jgi:hypothetical protein